ncbi:serine/threonine-protein kinase [Pseudonocardia sp.]|uniref:serine/threonine-protein kinase n=1 Tax=Pseudonocardia sp. TaxID=60912 RepID=UPI0026144CC2|nr:serine/threonine-protein kinase [Pseudonocardia sp.]
MPPGPDPTRRIPDPTRRFDGPSTARTPGPAAGPTPGALLGGRYRLQELLGSGGMADAYRAEDQRLNRPVAVKIFRPGTDPDGERRFTEEAQLLANLRHPGLVAVHDFAVEQHRAYLVMELVDGPTLAQELAREPYDAAAATQVGVELARVLAYVHDEGVVHRDVKPSNILVEPDGRVRLADFGISRLVGTSGLTSADGTIGTAGYLAPEQVRGETAGPPADIYALGLVLLEAMTGEREYPGDGWDSADERLRRAPSVPRTVPKPLRSTLVAMTAADPARRPDAREVVTRLDRPPVVVDEEPPRRGGRAALVALALVALLVVAVFALTRGGDETDPAAAPETTAEATQPPETTDAEQPTDEPVTDETDTQDPGIVIPDLPSDLPELPDLSGIPTELPDLPEIPQDTQDDARNLWEQFTDWFSSLF